MPARRKAAEITETLTSFQMLSSRLCKLTCNWRRGALDGALTWTVVELQ
jgi:hypothetical protein